MPRTRDDVERVAERSGPPLELVREAKLANLLAPVAADLDRLEASGVVLHDGLLWVIFDNLPHVAAIDPALVPGLEGVRVVRRRGPALGYEDIAQDETTGRRYLLIEAARTPDRGLRPQIDEYDAAWLPVRRRWIELDVEKRNKGLEGLTVVHRDGRPYLLALSEGNGNHGGELGRHPGGGLIHVLEDQGEAWTVLERIQLPADLPFIDFSAISARGDRIAVASQESSALWVGTLDPDRWQVRGAGEVHPFPRDPRGRLLYGNVEGVTWLDDRTVAVVSDRAKRGAPHRERATGESVHVFALPPAPALPAGPVLPAASALKTASALPAARTVGTVDG